METAVLLDKKVAISAVILERTAKRMKRFFQEQLVADEAGITVDQWVILQQLDKEDGLNQYEIAKAVFKDAPTVTRILDLLVDKELVARIPDVSDRRRFNIVLTPQGKEKVETVRPCMKAGRERAWAGLDDEAISQLIESLNQVFENIKQPNQS
ncbi:MAG: MarR family transcriptional regulator [Saprospiraceae bacterium]|nr:MarR family transcriptional regulator [Saprospiraceae bacterium]MCB9326300.1 MarR family transcriptional regulator [Lewinellaceae bacterium]